MGENQAKGNLERDKIPKMEIGHILRQENESIAKKKPLSGARKVEEEEEGP
jgi:hypothetical protein